MPKRINTAHPGGLTGLYFHGFTLDGKLAWQGRVQQRVYGEFYLVRLFEWLMGEDDDYRIVDLHTMMTLRWHLYDTVEEMRDWYARHKEAYSGTP